MCAIQGTVEPHGCWNLEEQLEEKRVVRSLSHTLCLCPQEFILILTRKKKSALFFKAPFMMKKNPPN